MWKKAFFYGTEQECSMFPLICADQMCAGVRYHLSTPFKAPLTRSPLGPLSPVRPAAPF